MEAVFSFRKSEKDDEKLLFHAIQLTRLTLDSGQQGAFFSWSDAQIQIAIRDYHFVVADIKDQKSKKLIGFLGFQKLGFALQNPESQKMELEILLLGVLPEFQKLGVAKKLINYFAHNFCNQDSKIHLEVHERNHPAVALYNFLGFKVDRLRRNYYRDGGSALSMSTSARALRE